MYAAQGYPPPPAMRPNPGYTHYPPNPASSGSRENYTPLRVIGGLLVVVGIIIFGCAIANLALTWQLLLISGGSSIWEGLILIMTGAFGLSINERRMNSNSPCNLRMTFMISCIINAVLFIPGLIVTELILELPLYLAVSFLGQGSLGTIDGSYAGIQYILVFVIIAAAGLAFILSIVGASLVCCRKRSKNYDNIYGDPRGNANGAQSDQMRIPRAKFNNNMTTAQPNYNNMTTGQPNYNNMTTGQPNYNNMNTGQPNYTPDYMYQQQQAPMYQQQPMQYYRY